MNTELRHEIDSYRQKIQEAMRVYEAKQRQEHPVSSEMSVGYFTPKQLERFTQIDGLIFQVAKEFMAEIGICEYSLAREFPVLYTDNDRAMDYLLTVSDSDNQKQRLKFTYCPCSLFRLETFGCNQWSYLLVLVPKKQQDAALLEPKQVLDNFQNPEANTLKYARISTTKIDEISIRGLLMIAFSNPELQLAYEDMNS